MGQAMYVGRQNNEAARRRNLRALELKRFMQKMSPFARRRERRASQARQEEAARINPYPGCQPGTYTRMDDLWNKLGLRPLPERVTPEMHSETMHCSDPKANPIFLRQRLQERNRLPHFDSRRHTTMKHYSRRGSCYQQSQIASHHKHFRRPSIASEVMDDVLEGHGQGNTTPRRHTHTGVIRSRKISVESADTRDSLQSSSSSNQEGTRRRRTRPQSAPQLNAINGTDIY